jgi:putative transposase
VLQDALFRSDRAFKRFFAGGGYPRLKTRERYRSFTYPQGKAFRIREGGKKIRFSGIGFVRLRYHRPLEGKPKVAKVARYPSGKWYVSISCDLPDVPLRDATLTAFDLGLRNYLNSSYGTVTNPRKALKRSEKKLCREQRWLSRKRKDSQNRSKQRQRIARVHEKVTNQRRDFLCKTARSVVDSHEGLAFEKLHVSYMMRNPHLAKSIADAGWSTLVSITAYKAEKAGNPFVLVKPEGTTQECSGCGIVVAKSLAETVHYFSRCDLTLDRDHNAAINIKRRAGTVRSNSCREAASTDGISHPQVASSKQEAWSFTTR